MTHNPLRRPPDTLAPAPRYTTLEILKGLLRIPTGNTTHDDRITRAIVSAEIGIDLELGQAFPSLGSGLLGGEWIFTTAGAPPPGLAEITVAGASIWISHTDRHGADRSGDLPYPFDTIDRVAAAWISQPGGVEVLAEISAATEIDDYWQLTASAVPVWLPFEAITTTTVILSASIAPDTVPIEIAEAAAHIAMAIYKGGDAPGGVAGSDDLIGALDVSAMVAREIGRNPLLLGYKVGAGFGVA